MQTCFASQLHAFQGISTEKRWRKFSPNARGKIAFGIATQNAVVQTFIEPALHVRWKNQGKEEKQQLPVGPWGREKKLTRNAYFQSFTPSW